MSGDVLELFAGGVGGWAYGLGWAGYRTVAACEIDPWRRQVYAAVHPGVWVHDDVRTLTAGVLARAGIKPDIVVGSPPCQNISSANSKAKGVDGDGLFFEFVRLVDECRPVWACAENSPSLRTRGADRVIVALERAGYACWALVVRASDLGAPHRRARVWVVAADAERIGRGSRREGGPPAGSPGKSEPERPLLYADSDRWRREGGTEQDGGPQAGIEAPRRRDAGGLVADERAGSDSTDGSRDRRRSWPRPDFAQLDPTYSTAGIFGTQIAFRVSGDALMDDGLTEKLAGNGALYRAACAAQGDAIVPQIAYLIGRAMRRVMP